MAIQHVLYLNGDVPYTAPVERTAMVQRTPNTNMHGEPFDEATINAVWEKGIKEWGFYFYRRDRNGMTMARYEFGKKTAYGWEIDHIIPVSAGGTDNLENLQPLHWENNTAKGDSHPELFYAVKEEKNDQ